MKTKAIQKANDELFRRLYDKNDRPLFPSDEIYAVAVIGGKFVGGELQGGEPRWVVKWKLNHFEYTRFGDSALKETVYTSTDGVLPRSLGTGFTFYWPGSTPFNAETYRKFRPDTSRIDVEIEPIDDTRLNDNPAGAGLGEAIYKNRLATRPTWETFTLEGYEMITQIKPSSNHSGDYCGLLDSASGSKAFVTVERVMDPKDQYPPFPMMKVRYYSPEFKGVQVVITGHATLFRHFKDIDAEVWRWVQSYIVKVL